ncbi:MAG: T9SS type A sorting domain-containing protein [Ignavibacteriales bacterium]|nr:T9SS type A sorting domain-containing protein [Ignavibacteriales bacterium]
MDKNNKIHLVYDLWSGLFLIPVKLCYTCWGGTSWSVPEDIVDSAEWPSIELDSLGYLHLEYADAMKGSKYYTKTTMPLIVKVDEKKNNIPQEYELNQNYPNPFNPTTTINYQLPENSFVTIKVYDMLGKEVATLVNENKSAGYHRVNFNAGKLTSGVYVYTITANNFVQSKKMLLMK